MEGFSISPQQITYKRYLEWNYLGVSLPVLDILRRGKDMLDEKDLRILAELERDCRQRTNQIAKLTDIPVTTVFNRIKKLYSSGHIRQFRAVLDPEKMDRALLAFVFVTIKRDAIPAQDQEHADQTIITRIASFRCVQEVHSVTGEWDLLLKIRTKNIGELEHFLSGKLRTEQLIDRALTFCAMVSHKETTSLLYNGLTR
jgi:DNA-binding Lrp family transcriptional regulator